MYVLMLQYAMRLSYTELGAMINLGWTEVWNVNCEYMSECPR